MHSHPPSAHRTPALHTGAVSSPAARIDAYEMANLSPRTAGLPLTVWVSPRGNARHKARVKVSLTAGEMDIDNVAVIGIRQDPWLVTGALHIATLEQIAGWIRHNEAALLDYWDDVIDTAELIGKLQKRAA